MAFKMNLVRALDFNSIVGFAGEEKIISFADLQSHVHNNCKVLMFGLVKAANYSSCDSYLKEKRQM